MNQYARQRHMIVTGLLAMLAVAIILQMLRIQHSEQSASILDLGGLYAGSWDTLFPARGEIYDRDGHLLAGNQTVYEVGVDLSTDRDAHSIALSVSMILGLDYDEVYNRIVNPPSGLVYVVLQDYVLPGPVKELQGLKKDLAEKYAGEGSQSLAGLEFKEHLQRSYPENDLASNVLGFVNLEGQGYYGVEAKYNDLLAGVPINVWVPQDPNRAEERPQAPAGANLILTLDREIQSMVEEVLDGAVADSGAASGTIVVMDPASGAILAMASTPRMNLNEFWEYGEIYSKASEFNRAISMPYEPGSVFKIFTMAAALDAGTVVPGTIFTDTGVFELGGVYFTNWDKGSWGPQDMTGCLQHSLNVCLAWVASELGQDGFYSYMQRFGIGHTTGIDLNGEAAGRLKTPRDGDWYLVDLGTNSFGQGVAVTPIQMMAAASAIANGGQMVSPHVVYGLVSNGRQYNTPPQYLGSPISPETAETLNQMLATSLERGESLGAVPGYRVAGKTGTAQIPTASGYYNPDEINASFIGWGPVDAPRFMVYVWLEKPQSEEWASLVAAPVFRQVVERLVILMDIPPDDIRIGLSGQ